MKSDVSPKTGRTIRRAFVTSTDPSLNFKFTENNLMKTIDIGNKKKHAPAATPSSQAPLVLSDV